MLTFKKIHLFNYWLMNCGLNDPQGARQDELGKRFNFKGLFRLRVSTRAKKSGYLKGLENLAGLQPSFV